MQDLARRGKAQHYGTADAVRLLAILAVVTTHLMARARPQFHGKSHDFGYLGIWAVPTFFVLSGYLLSGPFLRAAVNGTAGPDPWLFLQRRCLRILPLYWFAVLFSVVTLCAMGNAPSFADVAAHLAMLQDFSGQLVQTLNPPLWTMPVDFEFYLALPMCAYAATLFVRRFPAARRASIIVAILTLGFALSCWYRALVLHVSTLTPNGFFVILDNGIGMGSAFIIGIALQFSAQRSHHALSQRAAYGCILASVLLFVVVARTMPVQFPQPILSGISAALLLYALPSIPAFVRLSDTRIVSLGARLAYAIYLLHYPILDITYAKLHLQEGNESFIILAIGTIVVLLPIAYLAQHFIERPFLGLKERKRESQSRTTANLLPSSDY